MPNSNTPSSLLYWFAAQPDDKFPLHGGSPYATRMSQATGILNEQVHPHVGTGATLADGGFLTDHGPKHIDTVIRRASSLLAHPEQSFPKFTPYEIYILILAIHFHDVGNIFGRAGHENKHSHVMKQLGVVLGNEMVERQAILRIASAHGGRINGDKDTISQLPHEDFVLGQPVRYRALAALLRFADELADDSHRAARYVEQLQVIPEESEVYHAYAKSLHSVFVDPGSRLIRLRYSFLREDAIQKYGKGVGGQPLGQVYLLDEIYERTLKMHLERIYCMRFLQGIIQVDTIEVTIEVYEDEYSPSPCIDKIGYRLQEEGYPHTNFSCLQDLCPDVTIDGADLVMHLQKGKE